MENTQVELNNYPSNAPKKPQTAKSRPVARVKQKLTTEKLNPSQQENQEAEINSVKPQMEELTETLDKNNIIERLIDMTLTMPGGSEISNAVNKGIKAGKELLARAHLEENIGQLMNASKKSKDDHKTNDHPVLDIFKFSDYRAFLKSYYNFEKNKNKGFSFRYFAKKASLRSPNYLKLIMDGKRNLTNEMIFKFAKAIGLSGSAFDYFENMVLYNQAKNNEERLYYSGRLQSKIMDVQKTDLNTDQLQILSRWYAGAIYEMAKCEPFHNDPDWIASKLLGSVAIEEIQATIDEMVKCGLLIKDEKNKISAKHEVLSKRHHNSLFARKFIKNMVKKGLDLFEVLPREQRKFYTYTFLLSNDKFEYIQDRIKSFERDLIQELVKLEEGCSNKDIMKVYQYNSQLFPLTKNIDQSK